MSLPALNEHVDNEGNYEIDNDNEYIEMHNEILTDTITPQPPIFESDDNLEHLNDSIDSLCAEEVGGEAILEKNELNVNDDDSKSDNTEKGKRGRVQNSKNIDYATIAHFESKSEFEKYWTDNH